LENPHEQAISAVKSRSGHEKLRLERTQLSLMHVNPLIRNDLEYVFQRMQSKAEKTHMELLASELTKLGISHAVLSGSTLDVVKFCSDSAEAILWECGLRIACSLVIRLRWALLRCRVVSGRSAQFRQLPIMELLAERRAQEHRPALILPCLLCFVYIYYFVELLEGFTFWTLMIAVLMVGFAIETMSVAFW